MGQIVLSKMVKASIGAVYDGLTRFDETAKHLTAIKRLEVLTPGPTRVGTKFRETRLMFGKEATETMEVTALEPGRSVTIGATSCGAEFRTEFRLTTVGEGTRIDQTTTWRAVTLVAKLMSPMSLLMKGAMRKMMEKDLEDFARAFGNA